jgi:L-threonylcarbamoyladenylate synthase
MTVLKATKDNIAKVAQIVRKGGVVIYPTETVYGLGCDPLNVEAVKRVLEIKGTRKSPLPILASNIDYVEKLAVVPRNGKCLAEKFWPGQLTMVCPKKTVLSDVVTFGLDTVGIRIPDSRVALHLIILSGGLLVGSSANRTGELPPRRIEDVSDELEDIVDVVLDGGTAMKGTPSTVVDLTSEKPKILREGPISLKEVLDALVFCA